MTAMRVTDRSTRGDIEEAIRAVMDRMNRMPMTWTQERADCGEIIDHLLDDWIAASN